MTETGGEKEEFIVETFFKHISDFATDKAKDLIEKDRDIQKTSTNPTWTQFLHLLVQFSNAEKTYLSLIFLGQKWFGRQRDNPRHSYQQLSQEFRKLEDAAMRRLGRSDFDDLLSHLCGQLYHFVTARQKTMDFYEQITAMSGAKNIIYEDLDNVIMEITQAHKKNFHHPLLSPLKTAFSYECDTIHHLLQCQILMTEWQFLPSLLQLHEAHSKLKSWGENASSKENKKSTFGSSKSSTLPVLYQWLVKYKQLLTSKFCLYFYDVLSKQTVAAEMKTKLGKTQEDFVSRITSFQRKTDASNISLVLDANGLQWQKGWGAYCHPAKVHEKPTGLKLYPAIFTHPGEYPAKHWPNVVMRITEIGTDIDKVHYFYDKTSQCTYFVAAVDSRISLVVVFECKKSEKDSNVNSFLHDTMQLLRCVKLFNSLRPGAK